MSFVLFKDWLTPLHLGSFVNCCFLEALACIVLLLAWRIWRFTITPIIYPDDPKELPYWIPGNVEMKHE
jgi:hypothetical protein